MLIIKLLYLHHLTKSFFHFRINIAELNYIQFLLHGWELKKTRISSEDNDTSKVLFQELVKSFKS